MVEIDGAAVTDVGSEWQHGHHITQVGMLCEAPLYIFFARRLIFPGITHISYTYIYIYKDVCMSACIHFWSSRQCGAWTRKETRTLMFSVALGALALAQGTCTIDAFVSDVVHWKTHTRIHVKSPKICRFLYLGLQKSQNAVGAFAFAQGARVMQGGN